MSAAGFFFYYSRQLQRKLKDAGAISPDSAKTAEELGLSKREMRTLKRLSFVGKVKEITDEKGEKRYYIAS